MVRTVLNTPGGSPGSLKNLYRWMNGLLGGSNEASGSRMVDRGSAHFYHSLVEYYEQSAGKWRSRWEVAKNEYSQGRDDYADAYSLDELKPARVYSTVSTIESMVLANRPRFFLSGFTATDDEKAVPVLEQALNNEWRDNFKMVGEVRLATRDCCKYGVGIMLSSYENDFETADVEEQEDAAEELRALHVEDPIISAAASSVEAQLAEQANADGPDELYENFEDDSRVVYGKVISRRVSPWNFLIDPDCTSMEDARWMGRVIIADIESVKSDKTLKNTANLKPSGTMMANGRFRELARDANRTDSSPIDLIYLYEIFIRQPGGDWDMCLIADGENEFLRYVKAPYWIGCPYKALRWNQDGETFFPLSDVDLVLSEILAERILLTKVFDGYAREHSDTTFYDKALGISEEELHAVADPVTGKYVGCKNPEGMAGKPLQNYFFKPPKDTKSPEALNILAMLERSMQVSSGLGPNQVGQGLKSGASATEAAEVGTYSRSRGANKFSAVEEFTAGVAKDRMGLMAQFYDAQDITRTAGKEAAAIWAEIDWVKADVQHGMAIGVEPGSTRQESEEGRINQLVTMLGIVAQNPVMMSLVNIPEMTKELFRLFGFNNGTKYLLMQDGVEFGNNAAKFAALQQFGGGGGAIGGSPPAVPGATGAQAQGGVS